MTQQTNMFYAEPDLVEVATEVVAIREHANGLAIAVASNLLRASSGGEPRDIGTVNRLKILDVTKGEGLTWLIVPATPDQLCVGDQVDLSIDASHRDQRRRLHTATHLFIRCACNHFDGFEVSVAEIEDDASSALIIGHADRALRHEDLCLIDRSMRSEVLKQRAVKSGKAKSVEAAEEKYGELFRVSARHGFRGRIRVIEIEGFDVNPCSGLHHSTTNIGPYVLEGECDQAQTDTVLEVRIRLSATWMYWFGEF